MSSVIWVCPGSPENAVSEPRYTEGQTGIFVSLQSVEYIGKHMSTQLNYYENKLAF